MARHFWLELVDGCQQDSTTIPRTHPKKNLHRGEPATSMLSQRPPMKLLAARMLTRGIHGGRSRIQAMLSCKQPPLAATCMHQREGLHTLPRIIKTVLHATKQHPEPVDASCQCCEAVDSVSLLEMLLLALRHGSIQGRQCDGADASDRGLPRNGSFEASDTTGG
jgi:hypothetical protein